MATTITKGGSSKGPQLMIKKNKEEVLNTAAPEAPKKPVKKPK